jgi:hypothetical protein
MYGPYASFLSVPGRNFRGPGCVIEARVSSCGLSPQVPEGFIRSFRHYKDIIRVCL